MTGLLTPALGRVLSARRAKRHDATAGVIVAICIIGVALLCALIPGMAPYDPAAIDPTEINRSASGAHLLGTDQLGRDIASRMVAGTRSAFFGPLAVAILTVALSTALALLAGYFGSWIDMVIGRVVDVLYSIPAIIVAIVVVGVMGGGFVLAIAVLCTFSIPNNTRLLRAAVMERRGLPFVEAAEVMGLRPWRVIVFHILPSIAPLIVNLFFLQIAFSIVDLSSLSFLGLGVPPGSPDWGRMLAENSTALMSHPIAAVAPAVALVGLAVAANIVGNWIYAKYEKAGLTR